MNLSKDEGEISPANSPSPGEKALVGERLVLSPIGGRVHKGLPTETLMRLPRGVYPKRR